MANTSKTHLLWTRSWGHGAVKSGSRCGRLVSADDMNVTEARAEVTCHFCKQIMDREDNAALRHMTCVA